MATYLGGLPVPTADHARSAAEVEGMPQPAHPFPPPPKQGLSQGDA